MPHSSNSRTFARLAKDRSANLWWGTDLSHVVASETLGLQNRCCPVRSWNGTPIRDGDIVLSRNVYKSETIDMWGKTRPILYTEGWHGVKRSAVNRGKYGSLPYPCAIYCGELKRPRCLISILSRSITWLRYHLCSSSPKGEAIVSKTIQCGCKTCLEYQFASVAQRRQHRFCKAEYKHRGFESLLWLFCLM